MLSDGGSAFHSWRGVGAFTELLTELEIDQIVAQNPQTNGKLEVLNANIQKELFNDDRLGNSALSSGAGALRTSNLIEQGRSPWQLNAACILRHF